MNQIIKSDPHLVTTLIPSLQLNQDGFVQVQIMLATVPTISLITNKQSITLLNPLFSYLGRVYSNNVMNYIILKASHEMRDQMYRLMPSKDDQNLRMFLSLGMSIICCTCTNYLGAARPPHWLITTYLKSQYFKV